MRKSPLLLLTALFLGACGTEEQTVNVTPLPAPSPATTTAQESLTVPQFLQQLQAIDLSQDADLAGARDNWVAFYQQARVDRSVVKNGYVVDCVPFEQQPGLVNASPADRAAALAHRVAGQAIDFRNHDFNALTECPAGDVPVIRPRLEHFQNHNRRAHFKDAKGTSTRTAKGEAGAQYNDAGYAYIDSPNVNVAGKTAIFAALNGGTGQAQVQNNSNGDHFLLQEWWVTELGNNLASLESGIITCNYWGSNVTKTLFVFSTPNGYGGGSARANRLNQYNLAGGFVQHPNTPSFGTPVGPVDYAVSYQKNDVGYEFYLIPVTSAGFGTPIDVGYWPFSHYAGFADFPSSPDFRYLQSGFELYVGKGDTLTGTTADGTIQGYGSFLTGATVQAADFLPVNSSTFSNSNPNVSHSQPVFGTFATTQFGTLNTVSFQGSD